MSSDHKSFTGKLWPFAVTQGFGVFNDHAFKMISIFAVTNQSKEYSDDALFLSFLTVIYVLPFLLFPLIAGFLADKFLKKRIMIAAKISEFLIMLLGALALFNFSEWGMWPLIGVMFLMASQSAFFSPAFNGSLPEIFGEHEIAHANGTVGLFTFIAVITGVGGGTILSGMFKDALGYCGLILSACSFLGLMAVFFAGKGNKGDATVKWSWDLFEKYRQGYRLLVGDKGILFAIIGESYFLTMGTAIQALSVLFAKHSLKMTDDLDIGLVLLVPAFGIGFGSYFAGRLSGKKVDVGMVPFAAIGMAMFLLATIYFPGSMHEWHGHIYYPGVLANLFMVGLCGGMFVIPLRSYYQQKTEEHSRGSLIANANVICFGMIMVSGLAMLFLTAGTGETKSGFLPELTHYCLSIDSALLFLWIGGITAVLGVALFITMPVHALRFFVSLFIRAIYRVDLQGDENIPAKGPVLLISNHISFIDGILISLITTRFVRFMIHEEYFYNPFFKWLFKPLGFVPVSDPGTSRGLKDALKKARSVLKDGEVLCIFPEGKITRNGIMSKFQKGTNFMIPPDIDVPIIPIYMANIWGSIFSYYSGKVKLRKPLELPYRIGITVGKPIPKGTSPYMQRRIVSELAADAQMNIQPREKTLHHTFLKLAKKHPFRQIFFDYNKKKSLGTPNYQIMIKAMLLSKLIRQNTKQKYVGVMLPNTVNTSVVILAVMLADKIPAVLNFSVSADVLKKSTNKANIDCVLTSRLFIKKAKIQETSQMVFLEDFASSISGAQKMSAFLQFALMPSFLLIKKLAPKTYRNMQEDAVLLFSSGSTGDPKGVRLSHHNINGDVNSLVKVMAWDFKNDSLLGNLPMFHSFGLSAFFWIPMMTGTKVVYIPNPLDASGAINAVKQHKLTILLAIPSLLQSYMRKSVKEDFDSLRLLIVGAEKLRKDIADVFYEKNEIMPMEGYGCTEAAPIISINIPDNVQRLSDSIGKLGSAGVPMQGICVKIVDLDTGEELEENQPGMMYVKGPNIMLGYLKDPEKTKEVLCDGWYKTGDIAKVDKDGYIFITGRISRFSKIGGEMVPHEMVEEALNFIVKPEKLSLAVLGAPDPKKGEKLLVVYADIEINPSEIIAELRKDGKLPSLWIPKAENFIKIDEIPRLGSGKLNILKLKEIIKSKIK